MDELPARKQPVLVGEEPALSVSTSEGRLYRWDNRIVNRPELKAQTKGFPSVTNVLSMLHKPALGPWSAKVVAEGAVDSVDRWHKKLREEPDSREEIIKYLKQEPIRQRDWSGARGSAIHNILELAYGQDMPLDEAYSRVVGDARYDGFQDAGLDEVARPLIRWFRENVIDMLYAEGTVYSIRHLFAGSFDVLVRTKDGRTAIVDYKTSKGVYSSNALQLQAYAMCEKLAVPVKPGDPRIADQTDEGPFSELVDFPVVDYGIICHLRGRHQSTIYEVEFSREMEKCVVGLRNLWQFDQVTRHHKWAARKTDYNVEGQDI